MADGSLHVTVYAPRLGCHSVVPWQRTRSRWLTPVACRLIHGQHDTDGRAGARRAVDGHRAAQERDALAHAHQAQVLAALGTGDDPLDVEAPARIAHFDQP